MRRIGNPVAAPFVPEYERMSRRAGCRVRCPGIDEAGAAPAFNERPLGPGPFLCPGWDGLCAAGKPREPRGGTG